MRVIDYIELLKRSRRIIVGASLVGLLLASAYALTKQPMYTSEATALVTADGAESVTDLTQGSDFSRDQAKNYAAIAASPYVLDRVRTQLGLGESTSVLASRVRTDALLDTSIISIAVDDPSPSRAARIANAVTYQLSRAVTRIAPDLDGRDIGVTITQLQTALPPPAPSTPSWLILMPAGLLGGLLVGVAIAVLRDATDERVTSVDRLAALGVADLAAAFTDPDSRKRRRSGQGLNRASAAPQFGAIAGSVLSIRRRSDRAPFVVLLTGAATSEWVEHLSVGLARAIARDSLQVLMVAALPSRLGLLDLVNVPVYDAEADADSALVNVLDIGPGTGTITVVRGGGSQSVEGLVRRASAAAHETDNQSGRYDVVMFADSSASGLDRAEIESLSPDATMLICDLGRVRKSQVTAAVNALRGAGVGVLRLVAVESPSAHRDSPVPVPSS